MAAQFAVELLLVDLEFSWTVEMEVAVPNGAGEWRLWLFRGSHIVPWSQPRYKPDCCGLVQRVSSYKHPHVR